MKYHYSVDPKKAAAEHIADSIHTHLQQGQRVVWLLSGGSGIEVARYTTELLKDDDVSNLTIALTDERYGPVGHANENWQQLLATEALPMNAHTYRILQGKSIEATTQDFTTWLQENLASADYSIGLFGIGADGHTAGIKPHSAPTTSDSAFCFTGEDYERITMSEHAIFQLNEVVVQAEGREKVPALRAAFAEEPSTADAPAAVLTMHPMAALYTSINQEEIL